MSRPHLPESSWVAIVNPAAGGGRCGQRAPALLEQLSTRGVVVDRVVHSEHPGHACRLAGELAQQGAQRFLAIGGDGTAFEVLNGMYPALAQLGQRGVLAPLPLGTGNSVARDFAPGGTDEIVKRLVAGQETGSWRRCDVMCLEAELEEGPGRILCLNTICFGFPAEVVELTNSRLKGLGMIGYTMAVAARLARLRPVDLDYRLPETAVQPSGPPLCVIVNNNKTFGGNMLVAPEARIDDGLMDLVRIAPVSRLRFAWVFPRIFRGRHASHPAVDIQQVPEVRFDRAPMAAAVLDGELEVLQPKALSVLPGAIDLAI